jgi:hypothetical protein
MGDLKLPITPAVRESLPLYGEFVQMISKKVNIKTIYVLVMFNSLSSGVFCPILDHL